MKKVICSIIFIFIFINFVFAYDYVQLTDADVEKFLGIVNEARLSLFKNDDNYKNLMFKKHEAEYLKKIINTDSKLDVLYAGLFNAIEIVDPEVFVKYGQLEDRKKDFFAYLLKENGIDYRDADVMASHESDFIHSAILVMLLGDASN